MLKFTMLAIVVIAISHLPDVVMGLPFGGNSVTSHCKDLRPAHHTAGQTSNAPYIITINTTTGYTPGESYLVTLQATNASAYPVHGFIIQLRNYNNETTRGVFTQWNSSLSVQADCDRLQDTITQFNPGRIDLPESISFIWFAPGAGSGPLRIWSSFVTSYPVFWVKGFISAEIPELGGTPLTTQQTPTSVTVDLSTCGTSKGCYRNPSNCSSQATCNYIYTQQTGTSPGGTPYIEVELSTTNSGWASIGYSLDMTMGGTDSPPDDVLACQNSGGSVSVKNGHIIVQGLRFHTLDNATNVGQGMTTLGASYSNGVLACRFRRYLYTGSPFDKDLRDTYHQFYVWDPTLGGGLASLNYHATNSPIISTSRLSANDKRMGLATATPSGSTAVVANVVLILLSTTMISAQFR